MSLGAFRQRRMRWTVRRLSSTLATMLKMKRMPAKIRGASGGITWTEYGLFDALNNPLPAQHGVSRIRSHPGDGRGARPPREVRFRHG